MSALKKQIKTKQKKPCQTIFQNGFAILHFYQWYMNVLVAPHLCKSFKF